MTHELILQGGIGSAEVVQWGWIFLIGYVALMLGFGYWGYKRVEGSGGGGTSSQDEYATARGGFGFLALALAYAATVASGATFMGIPALGYSVGFKAGYYAMLYPIGIFGGMLIVARVSKKVSDRFNSQSVPDFLGDRFQAPGLRVITALLSLFLLFYAMAQITAAGQMFDVILGVEYSNGIWIAGGLLLLYLSLGGSHADILTDAVQGAMMIAITVLILVMFAIGYGMDGGIGTVNAALDSSLQWDTHTNPDSPVFHSWWAILLLVIGHIGFTAQPHLGNKFFAIKSNRYIRRFMIIASVVGIFLPLMYLGGVLGAAQGIEVEAADQIIPALFVQSFHPILAAFLGVAILSAIISTADGLIISLSQIFANDLYRKSYVPWQGGDPESEAVQQRTLLISRISTVVLVIAAVVAVISPPQFLVILLWTGIGGIISSFGAPYMVGSLWRRTTVPAAYAATIIGFITFFLLHLGPQAGVMEGIYPFNQNPFASTGVGFLISLSVTFAVSFVTDPPSDEHLEKVFAAEERLVQGGEGTAAAGPEDPAPTDDD